MTGVRIRDLVSGEKRDLPVEALFVAIGHQPNTALFRGQIDLDATGYIRVPARHAHLGRGRVRVRRRDGSDLPPGGHRRRARAAWPRSTPSAGWPSRDRLTPKRAAGNTLRESPEADRGLDWESDGPLSSLSRDARTADRAIDRHRRGHRPRRARHLLQRRRVADPRLQDPTRSSAHNVVTLYPSLAEAQARDEGDARRRTTAGAASSRPSRPRSARRTARTSRSRSRARCSTTRRATKTARSASPRTCARSCARTSSRRSAKWPSGLSHEINNPLGVIVNQIELLERDVFKLARRRRRLGRVRAHSTRCGARSAGSPACCRGSASRPRARPTRRSTTSGRRGA